MCDEASYCLVQNLKHSGTAWDAGYGIIMAREVDNT
jgi:hypothetical protein